MTGSSMISFDSACRAEFNNIYISGVGPSEVCRAQKPTSNKQIIDGANICDAILICTVSGGANNICDAILICTASGGANNICDAILICTVSGGTNKICV